MRIGDPFWEKENTGSSESTKKFLDKKFKEVARANTKTNAEEKRDLHPNMHDLETFDSKVKKYVETRFELAKDIMSEFITGLNVAFGNVIICCGNHDVLRPLVLDEAAVTCKNTDDGSREYSATEVTAIMKPFENFLRAYP